MMPSTKWPRRLLWGLAGMGWLFWFGYEDRGLSVVLVLSALACAGYGWTLLAGWLGGHELAAGSVWRRSILAGGIAGLLVSPLAVMMMLVKISIHSHGVPDFTTADLWAVLTRTPVWGLVGVLIGGASALLLSQPVDRNPT